MVTYDKRRNYNPSATNNKLLTDHASIASLQTIKQEDSGFHGNNTKFPKRVKDNTIRLTKHKFRRNPISPHTQYQFHFIPSKHIVNGRRTVDLMKHRFPTTSINRKTIDNDFEADMRRRITERTEEDANAMLYVQLLLNLVQLLGVVFNGVIGK
jgi:hypothetical protein